MVPYGEMQVFRGAPCHPRGGLWVGYVKHSGVARLFCAQCGRERSGLLIEGGKGDA